MGGAAQNFQEETVFQTELLPKLYTQPPFEESLAAFEYDALLGPKCLRSSNRMSQLQPLPQNNGSELIEEHVNTIYDLKP